ncbi:MAG: tetratricopeptide repeat protein [Pirellulaceae bacterium]|nr:tetratricopeptide repeat protein [Pirellulaceae bacterium]
MQKPFIGLTLVAAWMLNAAFCPAQSPKFQDRTAGPAAKPSGLSAMGDSLSSGFKKGLDALGKPFEPLGAKDAPPDPTSLNSQSKPSADLYLAVGRSQEEKGLTGQAEENYRKALDASPNHLGAALAYGRLLGRRGRLDEAVEVYQKAIKSHPQDSRPYNDLGLCLASHGVFDRSLAALERAVQLEPKRAVYRNNAATVLVEMGNHRAAFGHLRAVHDEATAYYNLGYLLQKQGNNDAALRHFAAAIERNPAMEEARTWFEHLSNSGLEARSAAQIARRPEAPSRWETPVQARRQGSIEIGPPTPSAGGPPPRMNWQTPTPTPTTPTAQSDPSRAAIWSNGSAWSNESAWSNGVASNTSSALQQPSGATAPALQASAPRYSPLAPEWSRATAQVADRRSDVTPSNGSPPTAGPAMAAPTTSSAASRATSPPPQGVPTSADPRWGSLFEYSSRGEAVSTTPAATTATRTNNVVYPLPAVD